jgi:HD-like signal output (HDOD) protein
MPPSFSNTEPPAADILAEIPARGDFPAAGALIQRLRETVARENCRAIDVARIVLLDPGLSSKVLRLVNSAFYRQRSNPVSTVARAVILLGFGTIRELTIGCILLEEFHRHGGAREHVRDALARALRAALLAQALATRTGYPTPEEAYLLGLFANLGEAWVATFYPAEIERAQAVAHERGVPLDRAIAQSVGVTPDVLAASVLEHWNFPPLYLDYFRRPRSVERRPLTGSVEHLVTVVDLAARHAHGASETAPPAPVLLARFRSLFGLPDEPFVAAARTVAESWREHAVVLGLVSAPVAGAPDARDAREAAAPPPAAREAPPAPAAGVALATALPPPAAADAPRLLAVVGEVARALLASPDRNRAVVHVLEHLARAGRFDVAFIALLASDGVRLVGERGVGPGVDAAVRTLDVPLAPGAGLLADAALGRAPRLLVPASAAALVPPGAAPPALALRSCLVHPLVAHDAVRGVLLAGRDGGPPVSVDDLPLVRLLADLAGLALAAS